MPKSCNHPRTDRSPRILILGLMLLIAAPSGVAQQDTAAPEGFVGEFLTAESSVASRLVALAEAIPENRYGWRPAEGVRSISEVFMHVAQVNFSSAQAAGAPLPEGLPEDLSKVTSKAQVVSLLQGSFDLTQAVGQGMKSVDVSKPLPSTGSFSLRAAMMLLNNHRAEHLGQLIAYARSVGTVPPWSR